MTASLPRERAPEQVHGLGERAVRGGGVVALANVASERVLGVVLAPPVARARALEARAHHVAPLGWRVRVARPPDQQQLTLDLTRAGERAGVLVLAELAVMEAGRVPAGGAVHARIECGAEGEVAAGAVARDAERGGARLQVVERSAHVLVEVRDRGGLGVRLAALLALVVEAEHGPGRLDAVVDLGHRDQEPVAREAHSPAQRRLGEL